jgi:Right handed beta helix region/Protein of unknown function (DUF1565)
MTSSFTPASARRGRRPGLAMTLAAAGALLVVMSCAPAPPGGPSMPSLGLDASGRIVPDTDYPIPAGAVFMATNGNDANQGTRAAPVKTLNRAMSLVPASGTIVVRGGVYRDWYSNGTTYRILDKGITIQSYPHEQVWFDGTDVVPASQWVSAGGGRWYRDWATPQFCDAKYYQHPPTDQPTGNTGPCAHFDMDSSPQAPVAGDPQMVFVDGTRLEQRPALAELTSDSFFYDWAARRIYIATDPAGRTVELAARPLAFVLGGSNPGGNTVRGLGFRRYATNEFTNITGAAVYLGGSGPNEVERSVFTQMASGGLSLSNPRPGSRVKSVVFAHNGGNGMGANGGSRSGQRNDLVIDGNLFNGNNAEDFGWGCTASCAQANVKLGHMNGWTFESNVVQNGVGRAAGFWCDLSCRDGVTVNNYVANHGWFGIFYEVSEGGIIASNVVTGSTGAPGIAVASAHTKVYNNTIVDNQFGIWVYDDVRSPARGEDTGANTTGAELANNIIWDEPHYLIKAAEKPGTDFSVNTRPDQYFDVFDYNAYYRTNGSGQKVVNWNQGDDGGDVYFSSLAAFRDAHDWEGHGLDIAGGPDPFFVDKAAGDLRVRSSSPAYGSGMPLPADVAASLGQPTGAVVSRGALTWPRPPG